MTDTEILRRFTREMMGSLVAHMNDDELDVWMAPWQALADERRTTPGYPAWFMLRLNAARFQLLAVLVARSAASPSR